MIRRTCSKNYSLSRQFESSCIIRSSATSGDGEEEEEEEREKEKEK